MAHRKYKNMQKINFTIRYIREWNIIKSYISLTNGNIVEIGSNKGHTTLLMASNFLNKTVYTIDYSGTITMPNGQAHEQPSIIAEYAEFMPNVNVIDHDSHTFNYNSLLNVTTFFIDGDHSYEGVKADTEKAIEYLESHNGGYILMHDYRLDNKYPWMGVRKYVDSELARFTIIKPQRTVLAIFEVKTRK